MPCERLFCMTVGYEFVPRNWTLEGETDESPIRLPLTSLLVRTDDRWFLFDTGLGPELPDHHMYSLAKGQKPASFVHSFTSPKKKRVVVPARQAYSHSDSVGSR